MQGKSRCIPVSLPKYSTQGALSEKEQTRTTGTVLKKRAQVVGQGKKGYKIRAKAFLSVQKYNLKESKRTEELGKSRGVIWALPNVCYDTSS